MCSSGEDGDGRDVACVGSGVTSSTFLEDGNIETDGVVNFSLVVVGGCVDVVCEVDGCVVRGCVTCAWVVDDIFVGCVIGACVVGSYRVDVAGVSVVIFLAVWPI